MLFSTSHLTILLIQPEDARNINNREYNNECIIHTNVSINWNGYHISNETIGLLRIHITQPLHQLAMKQKIMLKRNGSYVYSINVKGFQSHIFMSNFNSHDTV